VDRLSCGRWLNAFHFARGLRFDVSNGIRLARATAWKQASGHQSHFCLKNQVQIAELMPEIFSGDCFLVGCANLFGRQKCAQ
jgi:hypothetical protein